MSVELASKMQAFVDKAEAIMEKDESELDPSAAALSLALLVGLNFQTLKDATQALQVPHD